MIEKNLTMEGIQREATKKTPFIDFSTDGKLIMRGSAFAENAREVFDPIIDWIMQLKTEEVIFELGLEYINTSCAKKLFELLKRLEANEQISTKTIQWFYEESDEDNLETGQILKESLPKLTFELIAEKS